MAVDRLYLHGFGATSWGFTAEECPIYQAMERLLSGKNVRLHAPSYHPEGNVKATMLHDFLKQVEQQAEALPCGRFEAVVGCSFGGFLASVLQDRRPDLFGKVVLLAPAIDNFSRNYEGKPCDAWHMPPDFVEELQALPARPTIRVPTQILHGLLDDDFGGSAPWRIHEWCDENAFVGRHFPSGVDHSLEPWLSEEMFPTIEGVPSLWDLLSWTLRSTDVLQQSELYSTSLFRCNSFSQSEYYPEGITA
jgi:pimeloyl-ACP methyl ester carboxylesterase